MSNLLYIIQFALGVFVARILADACIKYLERNKNDKD